MKDLKGKYSRRKTISLFFKCAVEYGLKTKKNWIIIFGTCATRFHKRVAD